MRNVQPAVHNRAVSWEVGGISPKLDFSGRTTARGGVVGRMHSGVGGTEGRGRGEEREAGERRRGERAESSSRNECVVNDVHNKGRNARHMREASCTATRDDDSKTCTQAPNGRREVQDRLRIEGNLRNRKGGELKSCRSLGEHSDLGVQGE